MKLYIPEERYACVSKGLGDAVFGGEVPTSRRASQMVRRAAPPGQIGRKKLFEAGRYRLTGMADGLMCVTQSEGDLVPRFKRCMTFLKKGVAVEGMAVLGAGVLGRFGSRAWKAIEVLWRRAGILIP